MSAAARLERSQSDRVIAGVCGGLSRYFQIDATIVRAFFVVGAILTFGVLALAYVALAVLMPLPGQRSIIEGAPPRSEGEVSEPTSIQAAAGESAPRALPAAATAAPDRRREALAYGLIVLGAALLLGNLGLFRLVDWDVILPLALIAFGAFLLLRRARS
jgi:phage shock protein C